MSMSTHVFAFRPPDKKWNAMKTVWDSCESAGVDIPEVVLDFFGGVCPDEAGVEANIPVTKYNASGEEGYEVKVADIPEGVQTIRFVNSY